MYGNKRRRAISPARRSIDLLVAVPALVLTAPIVLVAAVALRVGAGAPSVVRIERVGADGEIFEAFMLRTSSAVDGSSPSRGPAEAEPNDAARPVEESGVGRFVRATSIDELPLLWNVVRGDMTLMRPPAPGSHSSLVEFWERDDR